MPDPTDLRSLPADMLRHVEECHPTPEGRAGVRCGLGDAATLCDLAAKRVEASNPGRRKGTVSSVGQFGADLLRRAGDEVAELRDRVTVPADPTPPSHDLGAAEALAEELWRARLERATIKVSQPRRDGAALDAAPGAAVSGAGLTARCRAHDPQPAVTLTADGYGLFSPAARMVRCARCGLLGTPSSGRRRYGRPARIIWHRAGAQWAEEVVASFEAGRTARADAQEPQP